MRRSSARWRSIGSTSPPGPRPMASCNSATISTTATVSARWCRAPPSAPKLTRVSRRNGRRAPACEFLTHDRRNLGAEQLDRAHGLRVGHGADAHLHQIALMAERLVLVKDFRDHLLRAADREMTAQ